MQKRQQSNKIIGIYEIVNIYNNFRYIGSSINIPSRWKRHLRGLSKAKHHSILLQRAWDKYGKESFQFKIIQECTTNELVELEDYWFSIKKPEYNICKKAYSTLGCKPTEARKENQRQYAKLNGIRPPSYTWEKKRKKVEMLDYNTLESLKIFESISSACKFLTKTHRFVTTISSVCNGRRKSAFGYKWKWIN